MSQQEVTHKIASSLAIEGLTQADYRKHISIADGSLVETLRALRTVQQDAEADAAAVEVEILKLQGKKAVAKRRALRAAQAALDVMREEREGHGAMSDSGLYKVDLGDGTSASLTVYPTTELLCTPDAGDRLPDEFVIVKREPRKAVIKGLIATGQAFPGCTLIVKTWRSNPPAEEHVHWSKG